MYNKKLEILRILINYFYNMESETTMSIITSKLSINEFIPHIIYNGNIIKGISSIDEEYKKLCRKIEK